jgi:hypothetical protein
MLAAFLHFRVFIYLAAFYIEYNTERFPVADCYWDKVMKQNHREDIRQLNCDVKGSGKKKQLHLSLYGP